MTRKINSAYGRIAWPFLRPNSGGMQGFTLAELLIAIAIFALLVSIVMGSFNGVFLSTEALNVQRTNNEMVRACLERVATDLKNIYMELPPLFKPADMTDAPPAHRFAAGAALDGASPRVLLQLTSRSHISARRSFKPGLAVIRYYLETSGGAGDSVYRLRRSDALLLGDTLPELQADPILCENIKTIQFLCIDADGEEHETWDSSSSDADYATPRAVAIRIELAGPAGSNVYETTISLPVWRDASGKA
jgi:general secretion pathway protein J